MVFEHFLAISPRKCFRKILFTSGLAFCCLVLSVFGSGLTTSFVLSLFSLSFSFERQSSGLTGHHTPPRTCCCFSCFFSAALFCFACFGRASLFVSGVFSGCHSGPRAVFGFSRDCSEAFFSWTLGGKGVCSFLVCCFSRFAASHVSSGPCTWSQEGRPAGGLARSPCLSEGKG